MKKIYLNELDYKKSSNIEQIDYDVLKKEATVTFKNGRKYIYPNLEEGFINEWVGSESVGKFFSENMKHLPFKQLLVD